MLKQIVTSSACLLVFIVLVTSSVCLLNSTDLVTGAEGDTRNLNKKNLRVSELDLTTERVVVFKDGYCMVIKKGTAKTDAEGRAFSEEVPSAAVLGSFWAIPIDDAIIKSTTAGWVETQSESTTDIACLTTIEILQANLGATCTFVYDDAEFHGTIHKVLATNPPTAATPAAFDALGLGEQFPSFTARAQMSPAQTATSATHTATITKTTGNYFVVRNSKGDMMVPVNGVRRLVIDDMKSSLKQTVEQKSKQKRLTFQFDKPNHDVEILMMYFRPGVRWIPTYRVELTENDFVDITSNKTKKAKALANRKKIAEISLQGEVINEAEDLIDMPIDVVVGVPNFRFRSVASPMVLENTLRNVIAQMAPNVIRSGLNMNSMSNALYTQRGGEFQSSRAQGGEGSAEVELPEELKSSGGNDLYVYELPKMSLKKGERATVPILRTKVPYRDIYTWDIELKHSDSYAASSSGTVSPLVLAENKVWRQVELINETNIPWTTGAAMFVDGFRPLAQDLLTYTSPGGICRVPVTVAVDLRGRVEDRELKRDLKALRWRGHDYAKVTGEISIELANNKAVPVPVEVRIRFGGKAIATSDEGEIKLEIFHGNYWHGNGDPINNTSKVLWKSTISEGECLKPTVDYEFFIRY